MKGIHQRFDNFSIVDVDDAAALVPIQPYTLPELAEMYGKSRKCFIQWLKPIQPMLGRRIGHLFNIRQVKIIFDHFGAPVQRADR